MDGLGDSTALINQRRHQAHAQQAARVVLSGSSAGRSRGDDRTWIESGFYDQTRFIYVQNDGNKLLFESKSSRLSLESTFLVRACRRLRTVKNRGIQFVIGGCMRFYERTRSPPWV